MKTVVAALLLVASHLAAQVCPKEAPFATMLGVRTFPALAGAPVTLSAPGASECPLPPPGSSCPEYNYFIESCDVVQWTFGDGTTATAVGSDSITHTYAHTGVYNINVHISNSLGAVDVPGSIYIASSPGTTVAAGPRIIFGNELDSSITTHVTRSGDLSRPNTVNWHLNGDPGVMSDTSGTFTFAPGESDHPLTFPIRWDREWASIYVSLLDLTLAPDGAYPLESGHGLFFDNMKLQQVIEVYNADPEPVGTIRDVTVRKGSSSVHVPVEITVPFAPCCRASWVWHTIDGSARSGTDYVGTDSTLSWIDPEKLSAYIDVPLLPNAPSGTRTFDIEIKNSTISFMRKRATVTIVDDASSIVADPAQMTVVAGSSATLSLSAAPTRTADVPVNVTSSDPTVATVDSPVVIPAGGHATILVHGLKPGHPTISIASAGGTPTLVDVQVVFTKRRAVRP